MTWFFVLFFNAVTNQIINGLNFQHHIFKLEEGCSPITLELGVLPVLETVDRALRNIPLISQKPLWIGNLLFSILYSHC